MIIDECRMPGKNTAFWKAVRKSNANIAVDDTILSEVHRKTGKTGTKWWKRSQNPLRDQY